MKNTASNSDFWFDLDGDFEGPVWTLRRAKAIVGTIGRNLADQATS